MSLTMTQWPRRHRITVANYYRMAEAGLFEPGDRVELVNGDIVDMPPMGSRHAGILHRLARMLDAAIGERASVRQQLPLRLDDESEPQPDIALVEPREDDYIGRHPSACDVLLVVEVSLATLAYDRDVKVPLYARHGVPEAWIVDLNEDCLQVYREPAAGAYRSAEEPAEWGPIEVAAIPGVRLDLAALRQ